MIRLSPGRGRRPSPSRSRILPRTILEGDRDWGPSQRRGGTHTGTFAWPGLEPVPATGRAVRIPEHFFFYRVRGDVLVEIRPEPVPGGAPGGILEQIVGERSPVL